MSRPNDDVMANTIERDMDKSEVGISFQSEMSEIDLIEKDVASCRKKRKQT